MSNLKVKTTALFEDSGCLSLAGYRALIAKSLEGNEKEIAEKHLFSCELCQGAIEGLKLEASDIKVLKTVSAMKQKAQGSTKKVKVWPFIAAAASILFLVAIGNKFLKSTAEETNQKLFAQEMKPYPLPLEDSVFTEYDIPENEKSELKLPLAETTLKSSQKDLKAIDQIENKNYKNLATEDIVFEKPKLDAGIENYSSLADEESADDFSPAVSKAPEKETKPLSKKIAEGDFESANKDTVALSYSDKFAQDHIQSINATGSAINNTPSSVQYSAPISMNEVEISSSKKNRNIMPEAASKSSVSRADNDYQKLNYKEADAFYKLGKFAEASQLYEEILLNQPLDAKARFFAGVSRLQSGDAHRANLHFTQILTQPKHQYLYPAKWYQALSLIRLNQKKDAIPFLKELAETKGEFKEKASSLLKELE